jgi:hypothetical protein
MIDKDKVENFITSLDISEDTIIIFDPYMVSTEDLRHLMLKHKAGLVRMRRPAWGLGNIAGSIIKLKTEDFKKFLEIADETR